MRGRVCWISAVLVALLRCATVHDAHPTPDHPVAACYISCKEGFFMRSQHLCRGDRRRYLDIKITGEDDVPGDPRESRWFTGMPSFGADFVVDERLTAAGLRRGTTEWSQRYADELRAVQRELGDEARAAYNKQDVELSPCQLVIQRHCAGADSKCGTHAGEDLFGQPVPPP